MSELIIEGLRATVGGTEILRGVDPAVVVATGALDDPSALEDLAGYAASRAADA